MNRIWFILYWLWLLPVCVLGCVHNTHFMLPKRCKFRTGDGYAWSCYHGKWVVAHTPLHNQTYHVKTWLGLTSNKTEGSSIEGFYVLDSTKIIKQEMPCGLDSDRRYVSKIVVWEKPIGASRWISCEPKGKTHRGPFFYKEIRYVRHGKYIHWVQDGKKKLYERIYDRGTILRTIWHHSQDDKTL